MRAHDINTWTQTLATSDGPQTDAERIDTLRALEMLKCAAEAAQAMVTADLDVSQRAAQAAAGVPVERQGRGIAAQVALARRESPHRGQRHLGLAMVLRDELPCTMAAFRAGRITEWAATVVARETACLSLADRRLVDGELAGDPDSIEAMGVAELEAEAKAIAYRLDSESYVARRSRAEADRRVTLRPAPDVMSQLSALLPVKAGVAVLAALTRAADSAIADGDGRGRGQIMADTLVARVLSDSRDAEDVGVVINVVVSDRALFGASSDPGWVDGYGPVPADLVRELSTADATWLRRLYTATTGQLVAMDSRATRFPASLGQFLRLRDRRCRTPWCDAAIRHSDHVESRDEGGETSALNGQGLCEACNYAKEAVGWQARPRPGPRHTVETTTPTGHTYRSAAPTLVRQPRGIEIQLARWTLVA